jgi:AraC family transcriptional regulator, regulatory protein of adaptative response / methylated-DNA-[protein]-cysteine methyltransferase
MRGSDYSRVAEAIRFIEANLEYQPGLAEISRHIQLSAYHVHRLFRKWAGITPKDFLQVLTLAKAKRLLAASESVLNTSLALGLSGSGRLHDLFLSLEAMTPGEYKVAAAGLTIHWGIHPTTFGNALFAATERGLCGLVFVDGRMAQSACADLARRWPGAAFRENPRFLAPIAQEVDSRMRGKSAGSLHLALKGTSFQVKVWEALLSVPEGNVTTYQSLARHIGMPEAAHAVGRAAAANPVGYVIPCHRVIRATGAIGDYKWGAERKTVLLAVEGARKLAALSNQDTAR